MIKAFRVNGDPKPKGSKTTGVTKNGARYVRESNPNTMSWVQAVKDEAKSIMGHNGQTHNVQPPLQGPVKVKLVFYHRRNKDHFCADGSLKWWAPRWKQTAPDADKLARAFLDGLQPFVIKSDAQVVDLHALKLWCPLGQEPSVWVEVREIA